MATATSPFGSLRLSPGDAASLKELTQAFVERQVLSYERYVEREQRHLDQHRWKLTAHKEDVRVFIERFAHERGKSASVSVAATHAEEAQPQRKLTDVPPMLVVGTLQGTVEDAIYGLMTPTVDDMHLKSFYVGDQLPQGAVLATLESPSTEHPFRSHTIKWAAGYQLPVVRSIVKNRDFVYMEACGFAELRSGEKVGYHVLHSVHFPATHELSGFVRGNLSTCGIYRQRSDGVVEIFAKSMLNPAGSVSRPLVIKLAATSLLSCTNVVRCARRKKLAWMLRRRTTNVDVWSMTLVSNGPMCTSCGGRPGVLGTKFGECSLCLRPLCSPCKQKEELGIVASNGSVHGRKLSFCIGCLGNLDHVSARTFIHDEFVTSRGGMSDWGGNVSIEVRKFQSA